MSKFIPQILFYFITTIAMPVVASTQPNSSIEVKSLACDDTGTNCLALSHTQKQKYSLAIFKTDDAGNTWYKLPINLYIRIGNEESLDSTKGMQIACDQYLQNCLIGLTILQGHAFIFYGTNNSGQTWKGTIIDHAVAKTMLSEYITHLSCNASSASQCHLVTNTNAIYTLNTNYNDSEIFGPDSLNLTMRPMFEKYNQSI